MERQNALNCNSIDNTRNYTQAIHRNFRARAGGGSNPLYGTRDCPICYEQFDQSGNNLAESKPCGHTSCEECLANHFTSTLLNFNCPSCRAEIIEIVTISDNSTPRNEEPQNFLNRVIPNIQVQPQLTFFSPPRTRQRVNINFNNYRQLIELIPSIPIIQIESQNSTTTDTFLALFKKAPESEKFLDKNTGIVFMTHIHNSESDSEDNSNNTDLFIIADISGSMYTRIDDLKEGIIQIINKLKQNQRFSIILFNDYAYHLFGLQQITSTNKDSIINKINLISVGGGTNFNPAFQLLESVLEDAIRTGPNRKIVTLFFSDGDHYDVLDYELIDRIYSINPSLNMYTASVGGDVNGNQSLIPILRKRPYELSRYIHIPDISEFENKLSDIIGENSDNYATNIRIKFINAVPLSGQIVNDVIVEIANLNTNSEIIIPFEIVNIENNENNEINITYSFQKSTGENISGTFTEDAANILPDALTIFFPRKKIISAEIIKITSNSTLSNRAKHSALLEFKNTITQEILGDFYNEFITEITQIMDSYIYQDNHSQNISSETQAGLVRSHTTPMSRSITRAVSSGMRTQTQQVAVEDMDMDL